MADLIVNSTVKPTTLAGTWNTTDENMFNFDDKRQRVVIAIILLIASLAGTFGNSLVILSVLLSRKLRSPTNVFVVNLSAADLLTCLALPWNIVALLSFDGWPIADWVCSVAAVILYIPVFTSVITLASIGVNRLIIITQPVHVYRKIFCTKVLCIWIILLWLYPFIVTVIPPFAADFGALGYNERFHSCSSRSSNKYSDEYDLMTAVLIYPIPLLTILISYIGIFVHVRKKANKLQNNPGSPTGASVTEDSITVPPHGGPVYPDSSTSPPLSPTIQESNPDKTNAKDDTLTELPVSKAVVQLRGDPQSPKTNSLPMRNSQYKSPHNGVGRTSSYPVGEKIARNGTSNSPLRKNTGSNRKSLSQRIRSTIKEATALKRISRRQLAITKNMFYVVVAYVICLTPFVFCLVIDTKLSTILIPYSAALIFFNSCINPAIYAVKHPYFKKIFSLLVRCQWYKIPEPSDTLRRIMSKGFCKPKL